jgi:altronate dehydratase
MPNSITQLVIGTAVAIAVASAVGSTPAVGQTERILVNQDEPAVVSETNPRIEDYQQLRRLFLDGSSGRLR